MIILAFIFSFFRTVKFQFKQLKTKLSIVNLFCLIEIVNLLKLMSMKIFLCRNCWLRTGGDNKGTR